MRQDQSHKIYWRINKTIQVIKWLWYDPKLKVRQQHILLANVANIGLLHSRLMFTMEWLKSTTFLLSFSFCGVLLEAKWFVDGNNDVKMGGWTMIWALYIVLLVPSLLFFHFFLPLTPQVQHRFHSKLHFGKTLSHRSHRDRGSDTNWYKLISYHMFLGRKGRKNGS